MEGFVFDRDAGCLFISGELTIYQAAQARTQLLKALESGSLQSLDLAGVTEIDSAGLQLLICVRKLLSPAPTIINASEPVRSALALMCLDNDLLHVPVENSRES